MVNGDSFLKGISDREYPVLITRGELPPRNVYSPHVPTKLAKIINKAIEVDPNQRYQDAGSFRRELSSIDVPIDWKLETNNNWRQKWIGRSNKMNYSVTVTHNTFTNKYIIITRKGVSLRKYNKYCFEQLTQKQLLKVLHKLLTKKLS